MASSGCPFGGRGEVIGPVRTSERTCTIPNEWSDPRLQGTDTYRDLGVSYAHESGLYIGQYVHDIVTEDGAWRMRPQFRFYSVDGGPENFSGTWVLDGEGAYEGLSAVLHKTAEDAAPVRGFIVSTELLPPAPAALPTE